MSSKKVERKTMVNKGVTCINEDCDREAVALHMCHKHYMSERYLKEHPNRQKRGAYDKGTCSKCDGPVVCKGFCSYHYNEDRILRADPCAVEICQAGAFSRGLCRAHYQRWRLGKPLDVPIKERKRTRNIYKDSSGADAIIALLFPNEMT